jgi:hypothetical protein
MVNEALVYPVARKGQGGLVLFVLTFLNIGPLYLSDPYNSWQRSGCSTNPGPSIPLLRLFANREALYEILSDEAISVLSTYLRMPFPQDRAIGSTAGKQRLSFSLLKTQ